MYMLNEDAKEFETPDGTKVWATRFSVIWGSLSEDPAAINGYTEVFSTFDREVAEDFLFMMRFVSTMRHNL